jgi:hypothetical protein
MKIRDRIKELRRVRGSELLANPKNWRVHPHAQAQALRVLLSEIGYADALIARELPDNSSTGICEPKPHRAKRFRCWCST